MGRSISLFSSAEATEADFRQWVAAFGGTLWEDERPGLNVTFSEGGCHVWVYGVEFPPAEATDPPSAYVLQHLHGEARTRLELALSHEEGSASLALRLALGFLDRWPGVAEFPMFTALARREGALSLPQTVAGDFFGSEVQVLTAQGRNLDSVIEECGGLVIGTDDAELRASAMAALGSDADADLDTVVGVIPADGSYVWILTRKFDPATVHPWNLLAPTICHDIGDAPMAAIRLVVEPLTDDRERERAVALALANRISSLGASVMLGLFYVVLGPQQIQAVLQSGQWALLR